MGDPLFEDNLNWCMLTSDSPCIDAGSPDTGGLMLPDFDLGGKPRLADGNGDGVVTIDIGCFEWQPITTGVLSGLVRDALTQDPIGGALVQINGQSLESDASGLFLIELDAGIYALTCVAAGYEEYVMEGIEVLAGQTTDITILMQASSSVDDCVPATHARLIAFPNPFKTSTELQWDSQNAIRAEIFNLRGQLVRQYSERSILSSRKLLWDGRDHNGCLVPNGIYYGRISFAKSSVTTKLVLMR